MFVQKEEVGVFRLELVVSGLSGVMKTKMTMIGVFVQWTQRGAARALGLSRPRRLGGEMVQQHVSETRSYLGRGRRIFVPLEVDTVNNRNDAIQLEPLRCELSDLQREGSGKC